MRVLITRPEREATALAQALAGRGHQAVLAPLFRLQILHPPDDFAQALAASQAVLVTSANGARALAEASELRSKPVFAVGDTTAATAEGLGFTSVVSAAGDAAALQALVRERLDPANGPLLHISGTDVTGEPAPEGFERWASTNVYRQRQEGYVTATVALPLGDISSWQTRALADDPTLSHVGLVYSETGSGVIHDVQAVGAVVRAAGRRMIVDAVSAFGALPLVGRFFRAALSGLP